MKKETLPPLTPPKIGGGSYIKPPSLLRRGWGWLGFVALNLSCLVLCSQISEGAVKPSKPNENVINEDSSPWRRDPFIRNAKKIPAINTANRKLNGYKTATPAVQNEEINLQGIMRADNTYHALINGRVVKAGNKIAAATVKRISRYQVIVQNAKRENIVYDIYQGRIDKDRGKK